MMNYIRKCRNVGLVSRVASYARAHMIKGGLNPSLHYMEQNHVHD